MMGFHDETGIVVEVSWKRKFLSLLEGFLSGLGIPSAGIKAKFKGALKVSYSFQDVNRLWVDINVVGKLIKGKAVDKESPAVTIFFGKDPYRFFVLDSVITSTDFTISVDRSSSRDFQLDVPAIQSIVGDLKTGVKVSSSNGLDLTFNGDKQLAFAFSCVQFSLIPDSGVIGAIEPKDDIMKTFGLPASFEKQYALSYAPDRVLLSQEASLIEIK